MPAVQSAKSHAAVDPIFHYVILPLVTLNFAFSFVLSHNHRAEHPHITVWWIVLSAVFMLMAFKTRIYALRNQDRLIRLEERLRLTALLPLAEHASIHSFSTSQLIALRFASDAELPSLARRSFAEQLTAKQIKEAITTWRLDHQRI